MFNVDYWFIFPLVLLGAIAANATGAGGGVVFVPAFHMLGIREESIIATSFAIQCFGMTAGMIAWRKLAIERQASENFTESKIWQSYQPMIRRLALPAIAGVLIGQHVLSVESAEQVRGLFKSFSIVFGIAILVTTVYLARFSDELSPVNVNRSLTALMVSVSLVGGVITAWLSIGVGELLAVMLILLRFPVRYAIGVAVSISAICVLVGVQYYVWVNTTIHYQILVFAAPAALIGGSVAKKITSYFSALQLKVFIAFWVLISAVLI